jgi:hypothetical protein
MHYVAWRSNALRFNGGASPFASASVARAGWIGGYDTFVPSDQASVGGGWALQLSAGVHCSTLD